MGLLTKPYNPPNPFPPIDDGVSWRREEAGATPTAADGGWRRRPWPEQPKHRAGQGGRSLPLPPVARRPLLALASNPWIGRRSDLSLPFFQSFLLYMFILFCWAASDHGVANAHIIYAMDMANMVGLRLLPIMSPQWLLFFVYYFGWFYLPLWDVLNS